MATPRRVVPSDPNAAGDRPTTTTAPRTSAAAQAAARAGVGVNQYSSGKGPIYIGVEKGSDLETYGYQTKPADPYATSGPASFSRSQKPRYKVGYLNSEDFALELGNMNTDAIRVYQEFMHRAGVLKKYRPGEMDKPTRNAFKELITTANQRGTTWQSVLDGAIATPEVGAEDEERDPFQAVLEDPASLREAFQKTAQEIYGGDLPDAEVDAMVNAFQSQQIAKQQAAYDAEGLGGTVANPRMDPSAYVAEELKAKHPQQLDRVKFQDSLSKVMDAFGSGGSA